MHVYTTICVWMSRKRERERAGEETHRQSERERERPGESDRKKGRVSRRERDQVG